MVRGVDGGGVGQILAADELDWREADEQLGFGPGAGDRVLLGAGFIPQAADQGDAAEDEAFGRPPG